MVLQKNAHPVRWFGPHPKSLKDVRQGSEMIRLAAVWKIDSNVSKLEVVRRLLQ